MKRILALILVLLFCVAVTVACLDKDQADNSDKNHKESEKVSATNADKDDETKENTNGNMISYTVDPKNYYKFVDFEIAEGDFRQAVVAHMRKQASVEWTALQTMMVDEDFESWGVNLVYEEGQKYTGMLYTDMKSSYYQFANIINANGGKYGVETKSWKDVVGVQCCSAVMNSFQQVTNTVEGYTDVFIPNESKNSIGIKLGDYVVEKEEYHTDVIVKANPADVMFKAYAMLDVGDIVVTRIGGANHIRVVSEKAKVFESNGRINPARSTIKTVEQTNQFDKTRQDVKTTWWMDHTYTFSDLYEKSYIPVTVAAYEDQKSEQPYLALDKASTPELLAKGSIAGTVSSNYTVNYLYLDIYNQNGKLVKRYTQSDMADTHKIGLRKLSAQVFDGSFGAGNYTFVIEAGIALGSAELYRVDFTYNG